MSYRELKMYIARAGLTIREFAELLDMHPTSITNIKQKGCVPKKIAMIASLIVLLIESEVKIDDIKKRIKEVKIDDIKKRIK